MAFCPVCKGTGKITQSKWCIDCNGTGHVDNNTLKFIEYYQNKKAVENEIQKLEQETPVECDVTNS